MTVIQVKRIGSYLEVDEQGYLQSRADVANITGAWRSAVEMLVNVYLKSWSDIHSIYVRGSLAKGLAIEGVSDLDSFAVLGLNKVQTASYDEFGVWAHETGKMIQQAFPFVAGVEVGLEAFSGLQDRENPYTFILKAEAACVYGESLIGGIAPYKLNPEVALQTRVVAHPQQTATLSRL